MRVFIGLDHPAGQCTGAAHILPRDLPGGGGTHSSHDVRQEAGVPILRRHGPRHAGAKWSCLLLVRVGCIALPRAAFRNREGKEGAARPACCNNIEH